MAQYEFFQHRECEYFPCHKGMEETDFNCLFCYCPLYALGDKCGGNFVYTENGIKDCSSCRFPHERKNYPIVCRRLAEILQMAKRAPANPENP